MIFISPFFNRLLEYFGSFHGYIQADATGSWIRPFTVRYIYRPAPRGRGSGLRAWWWRGCKAGLVGPAQLSVAEGDRLRDLELVTDARHELGDVALPDRGARAAIVRGVLDSLILHGPTSPSCRVGSGGGGGAEQD